jgi:hypothetical protein
MSEADVSVVLAHGAWADGSSWSKVIAALQKKGVTTIAAPLPLTSLSDDVTRARSGFGAGRGATRARGSRLKLNPFHCQ